MSSFFNMVVKYIIMFKITDKLYSIFYKGIQTIVLCGKDLLYMDF